MKRHTSRNSRHDEKPKTSRNEDNDAVLRARTEEERRRRRRDWMIEEEKMDRHKIRRTLNTCLAPREERCNRSHRSRRESPSRRCRRTSAHRTHEDTVLSKKLETPSGTTSLFKRSKGTKINSIELCNIKVNIHRNIHGRVATNEVKRDIPNKEDVRLKRRAGEGSKPIFDREEIKRGIGETEEVEEHRTVVIVDLENSENKLKSLKRHSASLSPTATRNHSPSRTWFRRVWREDSDHEDKGRYRSNRERKDGERSYRERPRHHSRDRRQTENQRWLLF